MRGDDDDNEDSTFRPLAIAVASVLSKIGGNTHEQANDAPDKSASNDRKKREVDAEIQNREYVERRLRELSAFERRSMGKGFQRRTGRRMKK